MADRYEYEVAFSFCSRDEGLATSLDDLLKDRFKTFLYHRRQEVLAGTDGEKTFNEVFLERTRVAVILYRPEWGETPFTRIEQDAIRKRAFQEGYDFTVWIAVEEGVRLPKWVEPTRLYYGLPRYGIDGAAAVIETAIQRQGGNTRPESLTNRAERLNRQNVAQRERIAFLSSQPGVSAAIGAAWELIKAVAQRAEEFPDWGFKVETYVVPNMIENFAEVVAPQRVLKVTWHKPYANTLDKAELRVEVWKGPPPRPGRSYFRGMEPPCERRESFVFDRTLDGVDAWERDGKHLTQSSMVDHALRMLLDAINKAEMDQKPR